MSDTRTGVPVREIGVRAHPGATVAVLGNPNSGKSTLFNRLTGMRQKTANYPGVTVEKHSGVLNHNGTAIELIDLPGTVALTTQSIEEQLAVDYVLGRLPGEKQPDAILACVDATHLYQGLYLVQQSLEIGLPVLIALTMTDAAASSGIDIDIDQLSRRLGNVTICPVVATTGKGLEELRDQIIQLKSAKPAATPAYWPELNTAADEIRGRLQGVTRIAVERALIEPESAIANELAHSLGDVGSALLNRARLDLFGDHPPIALEAQKRFEWARSVLSDVQGQASELKSISSRIVGWLNQPLPGTVFLLLVMALVFQAVFAWATPLMDLIDGMTTWVANAIGNLLPDGVVQSFITDGIIAGVGSVIIFLPQILILFLFIIVLEDSGFLARAAYLMDRGMRSVGLSGQSIIPMISSFACAVPGIMATRVIPDRRDRIATIMAAPFMTCSARLPVYALLIAAFVPAQKFGWINLQGLVLLGLYLLGIVAGLVTALVLKKTALHGPKPSFALLLPEFRKPNLRTVAMQLLDRAKVFLKRAGTVIFVVAVLVWALAYFPRSAEVAAGLNADVAAAEQRLSGDVLDKEIARLENLAAAAQLEQSYLGQSGKLVAPAFAPLGWDWRVSAAVIAGFPAREVIVAVLGTVFALGDEADEATLSERLKGATHADGRPLFTVPMVVGLLVFYAFCLQCAATIAVIRRETNSWRWPIASWVYMTGVGYLGALLAFQLGS